MKGIFIYYTNPYDVYAYRMLLGKLNIVDELNVNFKTGLSNLNECNKIIFLLSSQSNIEEVLNVYKIAKANKMNTLLMHIHEDNKLEPIGLLKYEKIVNWSFPRLRSFCGA